jgi:hypothetical protein
MSVQAELQKLVKDTLAADASVMALVDGIHDRVPTSPFKAKMAYLAFGPSDVVSDDADCIVGDEITLQVDVFCRHSDLDVTCRRIVDAVKRSLHGQELELTTNALVEIRVDSRRVFRDPDGLTSHGVVTIIAMVEEPEVS